MLSGDVHHAYVARARFDVELDPEVYQLTCSRLHNYVAAAMKLVFRIAWSPLPSGRPGPAGLLAKLPPATGQPVPPVLATS